MKKYVLILLMLFFSVSAFAQTYNYNYNNTKITLTTSQMSNGYIKMSLCTESNCENYMMKSEQAKQFIKNMPYSFLFPSETMSTAIPLVNPSNSKTNDQIPHVKTWDVANQYSAEDDLEIEKLREYYKYFSKQQEEIAKKRYYGSIKPTVKPMIYSSVAKFKFANAANILNMYTFCSPKYENNCFNVMFEPNDKINEKFASNEWDVMLQQFFDQTKNLSNFQRSGYIAQILLKSGVINPVIIPTEDTLLNRLDTSTILLAKKNYNYDDGIGTLKHNHITIGLTAKNEEIIISVASDDMGLFYFYPLKNDWKVVQKTLDLINDKRNELKKNSKAIKALDIDKRLPYIAKNIFHYDIKN